MRSISLLVLLCLGVLVALAVQSIRQELSIQALKERAANAANQVRKYEDAIVQSKLKIQEINGFLTPINSKKSELEKKKKGMSDAAAQVVKNIEECKNQKTDAESTLTTALENLRTAKAQQGTEKEEAMDEIEQLKKKIQDRDMQVCEFVDMTQEEGRKLCGVDAAQK